MLEEYAVWKKNKFLKLFGHIYTCIVVCIGFVIFRSDSLEEAGSMIKTMITGFSMTKEMAGELHRLLDLQFIWMFVIGVIGAMPVCDMIKKFLEKRGKTWKGVGNIFSYVAAILLLTVCMLNLAGNSYNPFIYFRF